MNMIREKTDRTHSLTGKSSEQSQGGCSQQASSIKNLIAEELQAYSRRQPTVTQGSRRKPYY